MATNEELLRSENDGSVSFGNHKLNEKAKVEDFPHGGDLLKVKTFKEITKLEKNGLFVYESVPGTTVTSFKEGAEGVSFTVSGDEDAQITLGMADDTEYIVNLNGEKWDRMNSGMSGKLVLSIELSKLKEVKIDITKE